jgi:DNA polymerase III epsilon subunit-like protein
MAESMHGYSREYLRKHGENPLKAHKEFNIYASTLPIVSYNISFDWKRVLEPEFTRLNVPISGKRGFCALTLGRRLIDEVENYQLETLKIKFKLSSGKSHQALNDVESVVNLFQHVYRERLEKANIIGFENIAEFSKKTPVAKCLEIVKGKSLEPHKKKDKNEINKYFNELHGIFVGILADGEINSKELFFLHNWLKQCPVATEQSLVSVYEKIERIYEDGVVTNDEINDITKYLKSLIS